MESLDEDTETKSVIEFGLNSPCNVKCQNRIVTLQDFNETDETVKLLESLFEDNNRKFEELDRKYDIPLLEALTKPSYNALKRLIANNCTKIPSYLVWYSPIETIMEKGDIEVFKWYKQTNQLSIISLEMYNIAVKNGHLNMLIYLHSEKIPCSYDKTTCAIASKYNHLDILIWLRSQEPPCPWNDETCWNALNNQDENMLSWVKSNYPDYLITELYFFNHLRADEIEWKKYT